MLIFDELNDVRIVGVTTATALIGIAIIGMEWEARVRKIHLPIILIFLHFIWSYLLCVQAQLVLLVVLLISIADFLVGIFIPPTPDQVAQGNIGFYSKFYEAEGDCNSPFLFYVYLCITMTVTRQFKP